MDSCLFCRIIANELPSERIFEDESVVAIRDIQPKAPIHLLIVPRKHLATLNDASADDAALLGRLLSCAKQLAAAQGIAEKGYKVVINCGEHGGQVVPHLHVHLLGGEPLRGVL